MKITFPLILLIPAMAAAHDVQLDNQGGPLTLKTKPITATKNHASLFISNRQSVAGSDKGEESGGCDVSSRSGRLEVSLPPMLPYTMFSIWGGTLYPLVTIGAPG